MARITVEDCLRRENNRFALVLLASRRTKQLLTGARVLLKEQRSNKAVVTALREIASGVVRFMTSDEKLAQEEARARAVALARAAGEAEAAAAIPVSPPLPTLAPAALADSSSDGEELPAEDDSAVKEDAVVPESVPAENGEVQSVPPEQDDGTKPPT